MRTPRQTRPNPIGHHVNDTDPLRAAVEQYDRQLTAYLAMSAPARPDQPLAWLAWHDHVDLHLEQLRHAHTAAAEEVIDTAMTSTADDASTIAVLIGYVDAHAAWIEAQLEQRDIAGRWAQAHQHDPAAALASFTAELAPHHDRWNALAAQATAATTALRHATQ
jgi:hypothetical protein